jgi:hypothetical protein
MTISEQLSRSSGRRAASNSDPLEVSLKSLHKMEHQLAEMDRSKQIDCISTDSVHLRSFSGRADFFLSA